MMPSDCLIGNGIAVTGGIGCGKSRVCHWLTSHTAFRYISSDRIVRALLEEGARGWLQLRQVLSGHFFKDDLSLDKPALRKAIFADRSLKCEVEGVLHPLVYDEIYRQARCLQEVNTWCLIEIPLLYECGWDKCFVHVVVVACSAQVSVSRLVARDNVSPAEALAALDAQMPLVEKVEQADFVIENGGDWSATLEMLGKCKKKITAVAQQNYQI